MQVYRFFPMQLSAVLLFTLYISEAVQWLMVIINIHSNKIDTFRKEFKNIDYTV